MSGLEGIGASNEEILDIGLELVEQARARGIPLRLLGAVAIRLHCQTHQHLFDQAERPISDLDVMSYGTHRKAVQNLLKENKYIGDEHLIAIYGESRQIYQHPRIAGLKLDVFFDQLKFCHNVPFRGRLELDYPTITMTDALLEKMQIVKINAKDFKDTIILLLEHPPADHHETESLDGAYLSRLLGADWGFYYTVTENFEEGHRLHASRAIPRSGSDEASGTQRQSPARDPRSSAEDNEMEAAGQNRSEGQVVSGRGRNRTDLLRRPP